MAEQKKRYYWIKLKDSFYDNNGPIDALMSQKDGANYVVLYQMLCLNTINNGGRLESKVGELLLRFDIDKIQRIGRYFSIDTVRNALNLYKMLGLVYEEKDGTIVISEYNELVGSESDSASRKRLQRMREKERKMLASGESAEDGCDNECDNECDSECDIERDNVTIENKRIRDKDNKIIRDIDKRENKERKKRTQKEFVPPTLEEVESYAKEKGYDIDCKYFWEYYNEGEWIDGKGNPVKNWKQKLITWAKNGRGDRGGTGSNKQSGYGKTGGTDHGARKKDPDLVYFDANDSSTWYLFDG